MSDLVAGEGRVCFISLCGCNYDVFQVGFERNKKVSDGGGRQEKLFAKCFFNTCGILLRLSRYLAGGSKDAKRVATCFYVSASLFLHSPLKTRKGFNLILTGEMCYDVNFPRR